MSTEKTSKSPIAERFRGFLPVVIDVETGGFNPNTDALLEIAGVVIEMQEDGLLKRGQTWRYHIQPFEGANLEAASLAVNGIDPYHPLRLALTEHEALTQLFGEIRRAVKDSGCNIKRNPFHPFSCFDTATLGGVAFGQTVLAKLAMTAGIPWDSSEAHSAAYDAEVTADLFCCS